MSSFRDYSQWCRTSTLVLSTLLSSVVLTGAGCSSVKYNARYSSAVRHEPLPLRATVTVLISPSLRKEWKDGEKRRRLEIIRQGFQDALRADLRANGPVRPVVKRPQGRLVVTLNRVKRKETKLWIITWFLAPIWLFGVPMYKGAVDMGMDMQLSSSRGDLLRRTQLQAKCSHYQGIYYGHRDLTFGCASQKIAEELKELLSGSRADILAGVQRSTPRRRRVAATPARTRRAPIAVVFRIHDMSGKLEDRLLDQLTEYLNTQVASQLGFKVTPRDQIRKQITEAKVASYKACNDRSCQIELGKALAANKSVSTTLLHVGSRCVLNATVIDLRTEASVRAASVETTCGEDALLDGVKAVVRKLRRDSSP